MYPFKTIIQRNATQRKCVQIRVLKLNGKYPFLLLLLLKNQRKQVALINQEECLLPNSINDGKQQQCVQTKTRTTQEQIC